MENVYIRQIQELSEVPYDLLYLADPSRDAIEDYIYRGYGYVAILNKEVVGVYILLRTRPKTYEIINVAVVEEFQGKGIGKKLITHAINHVRDEGATTLVISTGNSSLSQLALYQKCGFRIVGVDTDYFVRNYKEKIIENGIHCKDMIRLQMNF